VVAVVENWWDKYRVPVADITRARDLAAAELNGFLKEMGYAG